MRVTKNLAKQYKLHLVILYITFIFFTAFLFFLPNRSFAGKNPTAECYRCIVGNYSNKPPCYDQCNADGMATKQIEEMLQAISAMKQSGPAQSDATSCNQFLNKLLNEPGNLQSVRKVPERDGVTTKEFYDDFKKIGILTGNFCTVDWLNKGQADIDQDDQISGDCAQCKTYCSGVSDKKQCFESKCSKIVGCGDNPYDDKLALNQFKTFKPISGGFGFNAGSNNDINDYIKDVLGIGSILFGLLAMIKIVFAGLMYATAAGNAQRIADAKSHILYAIIGLVLIITMNLILSILGASPLQL